MKERLRYTAAQSKTPDVLGQGSRRCQGRDFFQTPQVSIRSAELGSQKRLDEIPGNCRPDGSTAHTKDVHMIVLDALQCRFAYHLVCLRRLGQMHKLSNTQAMSYASIRGIATRTIGPRIAAAQFSHREDQSSLYPRSRQMTN